ncbi:integrase [Rhizobium leguminosarum]
MPDNFSAQQSDALVLLYAKYREDLDSTEIGGKWMPYRWWQLSESLNVRWMPYVEMLQGFASELANIINDLTHNVHRLRAWGKTVSTRSNDEKLAATHEFINILGTVALGQPYAIKSRFAYAAAHLCHQANRAKEAGAWKDEFPQKEALYLNEIEPFCRGWRAFRPFKLRVEPIAGNAFKDSSDDFRNAYNHRFSSRFVLGITSSASRFKNEEGGIAYAFGGNPPLALADMANLLEKERDLCYRAFEAFQKLVGEQTAAIARFEAADQASER